MIVVKQLKRIDILHLGFFAKAREPVAPSKVITLFIIAAGRNSSPRSRKLEPLELRTVKSSKIWLKNFKVKSYYWTINYIILNHKIVIDFHKRKFTVVQNKRKPGLIGCLCWICSKRIWPNLTVRFLDFFDTLDD